MADMMDLSFTTTDMILIALWFFVSLWNTSVGPTGGITFATMASVLPPTAVIPLQALVEASSSVFRVFILRHLVDLRFLATFVVSGAIGFAVGLAARTYFPPSDHMLQVIMGSFILITAWFPLSKLQLSGRGINWFVGTTTSFVSLFVGGVAALIATALHQKHDDHGKVIATMTASLIYQHSVKILIFGLLGFSFAAYAKLIIAMFIAALTGTIVGRHLLVNVPQQIIKTLFKILVTILGVKVLLQGLQGYWPQ